MYIIPWVIFQNIKFLISSTKPPLNLLSVYHVHMYASNSKCAFTRVEDNTGSLYFLN